MGETVAKANLLGSTINNWIKIAVIILTIIGGAYLTYYQIQSNTSKNIAQDVKDIALEEFIVREIGLWGERSDKRYKRVSEVEQRLEEEIHALEIELEETKLKIAFMKGKQYEQDKNK
jgi:hypothetical protein